MAVKNRKYIEDLIYKTFNELDPSGTNTAKYQNILSNLNEKEFEHWMKEFLGDDDENFVLDIVEFEHSLNMNQCEAAAKAINIPLTEYVYMPHLTMDKNNVVVSKEKCIVGYINIKRTQQTIYKKTSISTSNERTSPLTGQVTGDDENARDSDIEAAMLVGIGAEKILEELHGPRADDHIMKRQMNQSISNKGYVLLDELENVRTNKTTLNTISAFFISMGLFSNLVTDTYILPKTSLELFD